jgi:tetratricopeptide (TPR) repeat protein
MKRPLTICLGLFAGVAFFCANVCAQSAVDSAKVLFDSARFKEAEELLRAEISKTPNDPALHYWLGKCAFELYDDDAAFSSAERAVALDPNNADYHYFLGTTSGYKAEHSNWISGLSLAKKTQHEFMEAVRLNPNKLDAQRDLISFDIAAPGIAGGGDDKAEAQITKLDAVHPIQARLARMELYVNRKKWTQAEDEAKAVLAGRPRLVAPYLEVIEYFQNREDVVKMRDALGRVPRDVSSDPHVDYYRAVANVMAGQNLPEAQKALSAYIDKKPPPRREDHVSLGDAHSWLGKSYEMLGQKDAAITECRTALKLEPKNKRAHDCLRRIDSQ